MSEYTRTVKANTNSNSGNIDQTKTFKHYRNAVKETRAELMKLKADLKPQLDAIDERYSKEYGEKMRNDLMQTYNEALTTKKNALTAELTALEAEKRTRAMHYFTDAPSQEILNTIQAINLMGGKVSEGMLDALIDKCADNYLALCAVQRIADNSGLSFAITKNIDDAERDLNAVMASCRQMLDNIDADANNLGYREMELLSDSDTGLYTGIMAELDKSDAFAINAVKPEPTRMEILDSAIDKASADKNYFKYVKLREFKERNEDILLTDAEKEARLDKKISDLVGDELTEEAREYLEGGAK